MSSQSALDPLFMLISHSLANLQDAFNKVPGSQVITRYVVSSHQNDPGRTILELILVIFAVRTLLQSRTRTDRTAKHFIKFNDKEIDELVEEWSPEPLCADLSPEEERDLAAVNVVIGPNGPKPKLMATGKNALNLASYNFTGLAGNEEIKTRAVETLRKYGLGSCGPPGFYGTLDVHMQFEHDVADFLGAEAAILYSQGFSTIQSVIPAFCKRGDIIVADRGVNFAIQKALEISRSTVRWYDHNDLKSLEEVLESVERDRRKRRGPLTRRFIVTEGIFEKDGAMVDLPKIIELKLKHKYRLVLDESISFGTVGRTGRGLTELYNVPATQVDMLVGNVANSLCSSGGFCAGSKHVVDHQRINGTSFVFSASMPALLAVSASIGINILQSTPSTLTALQDNIRTIRSVLDKIEYVTVPSHPASAIIHINVKPVASPTLNVPTNTHVAPVVPKKSHPSSIHHRGDATVPFDIATEERLLQEIVDECLAQGVWVTRARRLRGQEMVEARPSIRLAMTSALTKKEVEKAANVIRSAITKVLAKRK